MNAGGDAADQMIRFYFEGIEVIAKLSGKGAEHVIALLLNIMKENQQTKGKTRLDSMLKSGKELKVFTIEKKDLDKFAKEAKSYGVLYSALIDRKNKNFDGMVDIMVRQEDASKINRIVERFKLTTSNPVQIKTEVTKELEKLKNEREQKDKGYQERSLDDLNKDNIILNPIQKEEITTENFNLAKIEQSPLSEPYSEISKEGKNEITKTRKSVRAELKEIKEDMKEKKDLKAKEKTKTKTKKSKGRKFKEVK